MKRSGKRLGILAAAIFGAALTFPAAARAQLDCDDIGGMDDGMGNCALNALYPCVGPTSIGIPGDLVIGIAGGIVCDGIAPGSDANNLALEVGGNLTVHGIISASGAPGAAGGSGGGNGSPGGAAGTIEIDVAGDMVVSSDGAVTANGGAGAAGGAGGTGGSGGMGGTGGPGGTIDINVQGAFTLQPVGTLGGSINADGGSGGTGGPGGTGGNGGNGSTGAAGGSVTIFSCHTVDRGSVTANGGAGGAGAAGSGTGNGGNGGNGAAGGTIAQGSGTDLLIASTAERQALAGEGGTGGTGGGGGAQGNPGTNGSNGAIHLNRCPGFDITIEQGAVILPMASEAEDAPCCATPGECSVEVTKEACVIPPSGAGCTGGAIALLLRYTGAGIVAPVTVEVAGSSGATASCNLPQLLGGGDVVCPGENGFTIDATADGLSKLGSRTTVRLRDAGSGQLLSEEILHTSCSCPDSFTLDGDTFHTNLVLAEPLCLDGASADNATGQKGYPSPLWTLAGLKDPSGTILPPGEGECDSQLPPPAGEACDIKDNKITAIQMTYVGGGCANTSFASPKSQAKGKKLKCQQFKGFAPDAEPVRIVVLAKDGNPTWFDSGAANVGLGESFAFQSSAAKKKELEGDTTIRIINSAGAKIEEITIHTHCHDRYVNVGDVYGGLEVTGVAGTKGGSLTQCPAVEYRYTLFSETDIDVLLCDDQLGEVGVFALEGGVETDPPISVSQELKLVEGQCEPTENTARVYDAALVDECPDPDSNGEPVCGQATARLVPAPPPPRQCDGAVVAFTVKYTGPSIGEATTVTFTGSDGATAVYALPGGLANSQVLTSAGENGFTIDAAADGKTKLGTRTAALISSAGGDVLEIFHTSCSCPSSFVVGGETFHTNFVTGEPACLDADSPDNPNGKGYPSPLWEVVDVKS